MNLDYDAIANKYQSLREIGQELIKKLVPMLSRKDIYAGAKTLGLLGKNSILVFGTQDESSVLMDYCIHSVFNGGKNLIERCLDDPGDFTIHETDYLMALAESHFSVFSLDAIEPAVGIHVIDFFRDAERVFLADYLLSGTAEPRMMFAGRLTPINDFFMTTGAVLPIFPESVEVVRGMLLPKRKHKLCELSKAEEAKLAGAITRLLLKNKSSEYMAYGSGGDTTAVMRAKEANVGPSLSQPESTQKIGRNSPCPCGSGKKYKKCCGLRH